MGMPRKVMTPEEVLECGKRIIVFPQSGKKGRDVYFVEDGRLTRIGMLWVDGVRHEVEIKDQSAYIEDIYPNIEMVYSKKKKGILLARRNGNRESNKHHPLPLRRTAKGMSEKLSRMQKTDAQSQMVAIQRVVNKRRKKRYYQEQQG